MTSYGPTTYTVVYNGKEYQTASHNWWVNPFDPYLKKVAPSYYGLSGKWLITDGRLFLIRLYQTRKFPQQDEEDIPDLTGFKAMNYYFPGQPMVFADWYSGVLPILYKEDKESSWGGIYLIFTIENGYVLSQKCQTYEEYHGCQYCGCDDDLPFC
jgi:hypothetical protein